MAKQYKVENIYKKINPVWKKNGIVETVPGSKSITNRALLLATLASGESTINGVLLSDDSRHFLKCVEELGVGIEVNGRKHSVKIDGCGGNIPKKEASVYVGSAGTAARFLAATLGVQKGIYHMDASQQMRKRPMKPLLDSLLKLGCEISYPENNEQDIKNSNIQGKENSIIQDQQSEGHFPFTLKANGFSTNDISINIDKSSQFLSALLIAAVMSPEDFTVNVEGSHGMAYIEMTTKMMNQFGVEVQENGGTSDSGKLKKNNIKSGDKNQKNNSTKSYVINAGQRYHGMVYDVEPDASAAAYYYAMCPLLEIPMKVKGTHFDSLQGDVYFIKILEMLGCRANDETDGILLLPPEDGVIKGIEIDMSSCSDQAITLAAIAPFANAPTTIKGIGHIRLQESDRLSAIATELSKMGIEVDEGKDYITIYPGSPKPSVVETYDDHRMAMGFSLIGLRTDGIVIDNPMCCKKTFERYFDKLDSLSEKLTIK